MPDAEPARPYRPRQQPSSKRSNDHALRARQMVGKYRIIKRIANGPYAAVYQALDQIEGVRVALKVPHATLVTPDMLDDFKSEVRITAKLRHPNILTIKNADFIDDRFVISYPLGTETLADRLQRRIGLPRVFDYAEQLLEAVAHAHDRRIIHCDIKPENIILFPDDRLCLTDFGISRVAQRTLSASGSGTVGYLAPEQALGKPRLESDVFSVGVVLYQMVTRDRPSWPFRWPLPGSRKLRENAPTEFAALLRRCLEVDYRRRFKDGRKLLTAYHRIQPAIERFVARKRRKTARSRR